MVLKGYLILNLHQISIFDWYYNIDTHGYVL